MSDLASTAVEFIERLDRGDFEQYVDSLSPRLVEWLRRGEWYGYIGPNRRVVESVADPRWPTRVAVVMDGGQQLMAVRVHFDEADRVVGFVWPSGPSRARFRNIVRLPTRGRHPCAHGFFVADLEASEAVAVRNGARVLHQADDRKTCADPAGHAFCLYPDSDVDHAATVGRVVIDCFSPRALAHFYAGFLDMHTVQDEPDLVVIAYPDGRLPNARLPTRPAVSRAPMARPELPSQIHLDLHFEDVDEARSKAEQLGAIPLPGGAGEHVVGLVDKQIADVHRAPQGRE